LRDILLQFAMGFCQFGQIRYIESSGAWGARIGMHCLFAFLALTNSAVRLRELRMEGLDSHKWDILVHDKWFVRTASCAIGGFFVGLIGFMFSRFAQDAIANHVEHLRWLSLIMISLLIFTYVLFEREFLRAVGRLVSFENRFVQNAPITPPQPVIHKAG
jgi:hypothetical protein